MCIAHSRRCIGVTAPPFLFFLSFFLSSQGKSTLVNCLTGLLAPTHGQAFIFGHSLNNVHRIQSEMGVCMQDDLLFEVREKGGKTHNEKTMKKLGT